MKICKKCIYNESIPSIYFDKKGICKYCLEIEKLKSIYKTGKSEGEELLNNIISEIKKSGKGKKYDCVIGVSGGTDSSYLLHKCVEWGLRPLAVHYDNTWNSSIATQNIKSVTNELNIDLSTYVIDSKESEDIFRSFLYAGVPEFDASTDIAFIQVLRKTASKFKIKYILEGHSFIEEGVSPQSNNYFDGKYITSIHSKYGKLRKLKTYPNLTFFQFIKWILFYRQKFIRPLWYINYSKDKAKKILREKYNWKDYGGHHLENRATQFLHTFYNPQKFNIDNRNWTLSALAREGKITRQRALEIYSTPIEVDKDLIDYVKKRLGLSDDELIKIMKGPKRSFKDFKTYKKRFEKMRFFFKVMANHNLVPMSFYLKYCFPIK